MYHGIYIIKSWPEFIFSLQFCSGWQYHYCFHCYATNKKGVSKCLENGMPQKLLIYVLWIAECIDISFLIKTSVVVQYHEYVQMCFVKCILSLSKNRLRNHLLWNVGNYCDYEWPTCRLIGHLLISRHDIKLSDIHTVYIILMLLLHILFDKINLCNISPAL